VAAAASEIGIMSLTAEDRLTITELLVKADNMASRRDVEGYVGLFAEDGILEGEKGEYRGRTSLANAVRNVWASEVSASRHLTLNIELDPIIGREDEVMATSTLLIVDPGPPPTPVNVSTIIQHVARAGTGWQIARRSVRSS
jgi:hypothetical protein